jgi:D-sedoheptulose 7-phosphate isomerase
MKQNVLDSLQEAASALDRLQSDAAAVDAIVRAATALVSAFRNGNRVFSCGNGGSMCDAIHFAEELSGRYRRDRAGLPAASISDPGHLSCVANDYGYEFVFSRYLQSHSRPGDVLVGISTSGNSRNVIQAARYAREHGVTTIVLTGRAGTELGAIADIEICTPAGAFADRVQELHIKVIHILIELVERRLFPANYETPAS